MFFFQVNRKKPLPSKKKIENHLEKQLGTKMVDLRVLKDLFDTVLRIEQVFRNCFEVLARVDCWLTFHFRLPIAF